MKVTYKYLLELNTMIDLININMRLAKNNLDKAARLIKKSADEKHPLDGVVISNSPKYKTKLKISETDMLMIKTHIARAFAQLEGCANEMANLVLAAESEPQNYDFPINENLLKRIHEKLEDDK